MKSYSGEGGKRREGREGREERGGKRREGREGKEEEEGRKSNS